MTEYFTNDVVPLPNKLGLSNPEQLKKAEASIVFLRIAEILKTPIQGSFDFAHLKAIHSKVFSDIYEFAGKVRTVNMAKGNSVFCYAQNIELAQEELFGRLKKDNLLKCLPRDEFVMKLAHCSGDLNALHPFREGNGRTIRTFLRQLAQNAGYELNFEDIDFSLLPNADIAAFNGRFDLLIKLLDTIITPIDLS